MIDEQQVFERVMRGFVPPDDSLERLILRRDRKRRNQRIAAGAVGIAVFVAAVWIVTTVGSFDRTQTPAVPGAETGPTVTGPAETGPTVAPETGSDGNGYRIPPAGTAVSTPVEGKLIAEAYVGVAGHIRVYADGRVLSSPRNGQPYVEQRLSPEGVELVLQVLGERVHLGYGSGAVRLESLLGGIWSRQSAWEDREGKPYVPARYGACFWRVDIPFSGVSARDRRLDVEAVLDLLPSSAQALLRGSNPALQPGCLEVSPEEARSLEEILKRGGAHPAEEPWQRVGAWLLPDGNGDQVGISLHPLFPDGLRFFHVPY